MTQHVKTHKEFKRELRNLLIKYNASIGFNCSDCSDTHGIYDDRIEADINGETIKLVDGWGVDSNDL